MSVQTKAMREVLEQEAAEGVKNFDALVDQFSDMLDKNVRFLVDWHDLKYQPGDPENPHAPFAERRIAGLELLATQKLEQARALAFARAFFRALRDRESELRTAAFPV